MKTVLVTAGHMVLLLVVASAVALSTNEFRGKKRIDIHRDFFPTKPPIDESGPKPPPKSTPDPNATVTTPPGHDGPSASAPPPSPQPNVPPPTSEPNAPPGADEKKFPYALVSLEDVHWAVESGAAAAQSTLIVDARADEPYERGHVPGALQLDYYSFQYYLDRVLRPAMSAEHVFVYCNGGDCEDSLLACQLLEEHGVPKEKIRLFKDGWEAWQKSGYAIETGKTPE